MILAHALSKINLTLQIKYLMKNGYHYMESVFLFLPDIYDTLIIDTNKEFSNESARIENISDESNSIRKAATLLRKNFSFKIPHIEIIKRIPMAAGLGGGSSDAACFVNAVFDIWGFSLNEKMNFVIAAKSLGADAVVFLYKYFLKKTHIMLKGTGITGEICDCDVSYLHKHFVLLVNNGVKLSTGAVFKNYQLKKSSSLKEVAIAMESSISDVLNDIALTNPMACDMSGSGATCFGIYDSIDNVLAAHAQLKKKYPFVELSRIA